MFAVVVTTSNISNIGDSVGALCALAREAGLSPLTKFCWWSPSSRSRGCAGAAAGCRTAPGTRRSRTRSASPSWRSRSPTSPAQHQPPYPKRGPDKIFFVIIIEIFFSPHGHRNRTYFWYLAKIFNGKEKNVCITYYLKQISERVEVSEAVLVSEAAELPGVLLQLCRRLDD